MIAIETKYIPATNTKGSRIKAFTSSGLSFTIPYPYGLSDEKAHFAAVKAMVAAKGYDWYLGGMRYGGTKNGYVFCFDCSKIGE
jgi:hypothetical protein